MGILRQNEVIPSWRWLGSVPRRSAHTLSLDSSDPPGLTQLSDTRINANPLLSFIFLDKLLLTLLAKSRKVPVPAKASKSGRQSGTEHMKGRTLQGPWWAPGGRASRRRRAFGEAGSRCAGLGLDRRSPLGLRVDGVWGGQGGDRQERGGKPWKSLSRPSPRCEASWHPVKGSRGPGVGGGWGQIQAGSWDDARGGGTDWSGGNGRGPPPIPGAPSRTL